MKEETETIFQIRGLHKSGLWVIIVEEIGLNDALDIRNNWERVVENDQKFICNINIENLNTFRSLKLETFDIISVIEKPK